MTSVNGEVGLRKWMMNRDTLECSGQKGSWDLGDLASGDNPTFDELLCCREFTDLILLFLIVTETMFFELGAGDRCTLYIHVVITPDCHPHKSVRPS